MTEVAHPPSTRMIWKIEAEIVAGGRIAASTVHQDPSRRFTITGGGNFGQTVASTNETGSSLSMSVELPDELVPQSTTDVISPPTRPLVRLWAESGTYRMPVGVATIDSATEPDGRISGTSPAIALQHARSPDPLLLSQLGDAGVYPLQDDRLALRAAEAAGLDTLGPPAPIAQIPVDLSTRRGYYFLEDNAALEPAVFDIATPIGLIPYVDRWGTYRFAYPLPHPLPAGWPSWHYSDLTATQMERTLDRITPTAAVVVSDSSVDASGDGYVLSSADRPGTVFPMWVDPRDPATSAGGPVYDIELDGVKEDGTAIAAAMLSHTFHEPDRVTIAPVEFDVIDAHTVGWVQSDSVGASGLYRAISTTVSWSEFGSSPSIVVVAQKLAE